MIFNINSTSGQTRFLTCVARVTCQYVIALSHYTVITRSCRGVVKFLRAPWDRRKMQKIVAKKFTFSQGGYVTASLRRLWHFYGVPTKCYGVPAEFQLAIDCALTARLRHGSRRPFNFIFKTARRYLRKRHSSSDSGGVTHTFAIRFMTSSIDIRMGGKNKKLKAGKTEGKGRESVVLRLLIHAVHRHCASKGKPWSSRPCLQRLHRPGPAGPAYRP